MNSIVSLELSLDCLQRRDLRGFNMVAPHNFLLLQSWMIGTLTSSTLSNSVGPCCAGIAVSWADTCLCNSSKDFDIASSCLPTKSAQETRRVKHSDLRYYGHRSRHATNCGAAGLIAPALSAFQVVCTRGLAPILANLRSFIRSSG